MADMSKENLERTLNSYIRNNWDGLRFDKEIESLTIINNSISLSEEYRGKNKYSFYGTVKLKEKGEPVEKVYSINGNVFIEEGEDSPLLKIRDTIVVCKKYTAY